MKVMDGLPIVCGASHTLLVGAAGGVIGGIPGLIIGHSYEHEFVPAADSVGGSPDDTVNVTVDEILEERAASFIGRINDRQYRFEKAEATYFWKQTTTGVTITTRGTRGMFRRKSVSVPH